MKPRDRKNEKFDARNFIAIDTETNGFDRNEPIQIAIVYFIGGKFLKHCNYYYMPEVESNHAAIKIHGQTKSKL